MKNFNKDNDKLKDSSIEKKNNDYEEQQKQNNQLAYEAGYQLNQLPENAKPNVEAIKAYEIGLKEREKTTPLTADNTKSLEKNKEEISKALNEAIHIQNLVKKELSNANLHYRTAEAGETYTGRVIGKSNSYIIQSNDKSAGEIIMHERGRISGSVTMNENAEISYPVGRAGIVRKEQNKQLQNQYQKQVKHNYERGR